MKTHRLAILSLLPLFFGFSAALTAQQGAIFTVAGTGVAGTGGTGGPAVNAQLSATGGMALDTGQNLYIADTGNNRVVRVDVATRTLTLVAGNGAAASSGDGGPAVSASLNYPRGLTFDSAGRLYIVERSGNRIRRVDPNTGIITTVVGDGTGGWNGDGGPAGSAWLSYPSAISFDGQNNLYIADTGNNRIRRVDGQTGIITTIAGNGIMEAAPDGTIAINAPLAQPVGVTADPYGNLAVTEMGSSRIRLIEAATGVLSTLAGNGSPTFTGDGMPAVSAGIGRPAGSVAVDAAHNFYFADGSGRVRRVDAATRTIVTVAGNGSGAQGVLASGGGGGSSCIATVAGDGGPAAIATLDGPIAVALTPDGHIFISDWLDCRVRLVNMPSPYQYTTTTVTGPAGTVVSGQTVALTATVRPIGSAYAVPTGMVQFVETAPYSAPVVLATAALQNGSITLWMPAPAAGTHNIVAYYNGDGVFNGSGSPVLPLTVSDRPVATVSLTSSVNPLVVNGTTTVTVTVAPPPTTGIQPTGSVQLFDGPALVTVGQLVNGTAQWPVFFSTVGAHTLRAEYGGDSNFAPASGTLSQTVLPQTTVSLTTSANPLTAGTAVTFTATITPATATGTVQFTDAGASLGAAAIVSGSATLSVANLSLGVHSIQAIYGGDAAVLPGSSPVLSQMVNPGTTTTLFSSAPASTYGQAVIFTAAISPASAAGAVEFRDGATVLGRESVIQGSAKITVSNLSSGAHAITAVYSGDSVYTGSTSAAVTQTVAAATPTITVTTMNNPTTAGGFVLFNISMTPASPGATLSILDGETVLATVPTAPSGAASYSTTSLTVGWHPITVSWAGDGNVLAGVSAVLKEQVQASTTTTMAAPGSSTFGQPVTVTATVSPASATGEVQFHDDVRALGKVTLVSGSASWTYVPSSAGTQYIGATFTDPNGIYIGSAGSATIEVAQLVPTVTLTASPNPSNVGEVVTLTASITPAAAMDNLYFYDGDTFIGAGTVSGGTVTIYKLFRDGGNHSLTARYDGTRDYARATSAAVIQVVKSATTTTLSGAGTSTYGQAVTLTATVAPAAASGSVQFLDGATPLGSVALGAGSATLTISTLTAGSHALTAVYSGDGSYAGSTSAVATHTVAKAAVTVTVSSGANPVPAGQAVVLTAAISNLAATGSVQFLDGDTPVGTGVVSNGAASASVSGLAMGIHSIRAVYSGDTNYSGGTSAVFALTVDKISTAVGIASSPNPAGPGQAVTFTATLSPAAATGTVQFLEADRVVGTAAVSGGLASITVSLTAGSHPIVAAYSGDSTYSAANSATLIQAVKRATTTTLASSLNPSTYGRVVQFTATVSIASAGGMVQFFDGGVAIGSGVVSAGTAAIAVSTLSGGTHSITAVYSGDAANGGSTSPALAQIVDKAASTATVSSSADPAAIGQAVTFTATVTPAAATGPVQFLDGGTVIATVQLSGGTAAFTTSGLAAGAHKISALYLGDGNFNADATPAFTQNVNKAK